LELRPGFTKATVSAWRVTLETRGLGSVSIKVRITAVRKLAMEPADTPVFWLLNWSRESRALKAPSPKASALGTGCRSGKHTGFRFIFTIDFT
jgi:hypothetical protein